VNGECLRAVQCAQVVQHRVFDHRVSPLLQASDATVKTIHPAADKKMPPMFRRLNSFA
jgi:hypothetical protein